MKVERFDSSEGVVWKYVFHFEKAIAEAVLYHYKTDYSNRIVICCSIQSGCPVGCTFCGTGSQFIRNLTADEIVSQIQYVLEDSKLKMMVEDNEADKFQIMFMSMGEPFLNFKQLDEAIDRLATHYPTAQLLVSTVGIDSPRKWERFIELSAWHDQIGLQFSLHSAYDNERDDLIPYENKLNVTQIRDYGTMWHVVTRRPVYLNYCVGKDGISDVERYRLKTMFSKEIFYFTFSVICETDETMQEASEKYSDIIEALVKDFREDGYNVRMFDPAGQDDIGGGCGQLWYVQKYLKECNNE